MGPPYQYSDPASNYAIAPTTTGANPTLNQQATAFTPRAAMNQGQGPRQGPRQGQTHAQPGGSNGHSANGEQDLNTVEDQLRRFNINQRPQ
jgi:hypothetical protein